MKRFWPLVASAGIVAVVFGSLILTGNFRSMEKLPLFNAIAVPIRAEGAVLKAFTPREWWITESGDPSGLSGVLGGSFFALHYLAALALVFWGADRLLSRRRRGREGAPASEPSR